MPSSCEIPGCSSPGSILFTLANVGLPGTSGFIGEFLTLLGTLRVNITVATLATLGVILSACYALWLYRKVIFGKLDKPALAAITDMGWRETAIFAPLIVLTLWLGFYPKPVLDMSAASVTALLDNYQRAIAPAKSAGLAKLELWPMNAVALSSMTPALPEIVLAVGAMALLMLGAYRERQRVTAVSVCSILLLIAAAAIVAVIPNGRVFGTELHRRRLCPLHGESWPMPARPSPSSCRSIISRPRNRRPSSTPS